MKTAPRFQNESRRTRHVPAMPRYSRAAFSFYQTGGHEVPGESSASRQGRLRQFRAIAERYFHSEAPAQQRRELVLFTIIVLISSWPVFMAIKLAVAAATW